MKRVFSTNNNDKLDPNWITGFSDAEGCFTVIISKRKDTLNWRVSVSFEINLHIKDIEILHKIKNYFGVGSIITRPNKNLCVYRLTKIKDLLSIIIPHFNKYPLLTQKYSDYVLWSKVVDLMSKKQHLSDQGFSTILSYYASINKGMSPSVSNAFPDIIGVKKDTIVLPNSLNPNWVSGFVAGDGGFSIGIRKKTEQIYFRFHITQHSRDSLLMNLFVKFFVSGKVNIRTNNKRCDYYVQDFLQIYNNIIPHFDKYPLNNIKSLDLIDFKKAINLFKAKGRDSINEIKEIISNMNSKREL